MKPALKVLPTNEPNTAWVDALEEALERARAGEVHGGAIVEDRGTTVRHTVSGLKNRWEFAGHLMNLVRETLDT